LSQSDHPENVKHPILLDKSGHLVQLLLRKAHLVSLHGGPQLTLFHLKQEYWIPGARNIARQYIRNCTICARFTSKPPVQIMGDLPEERITPSKPFTNTGLDFGGPFLTKVGATSKKLEKSYMALFVCFGTKAVHLEAVSALTTAACLAALRRFISRRGCPTTIFSDNGTNFIGARNELAALSKLLDTDKNQQSLSNFASSMGIQWVTIPPRAPHFGGLWEAAIKSAKYHLRRIVGNTSLTFEELTTILAQVEAVLNSRPLNAMSSDPNDLSVMTPGHFLVGEPLTALPEAKLPTLEVSRLKRWQLVQHLTRTFWKRWHLEYLGSLQERKKWKKTGEPLSIGQLVLIAEDNAPPLHWVMG